MKYGYLLLLFQKYHIFNLFVTHPKLRVETLCFVYYYLLKILSKAIQLGPTSTYLEYLGYLRSILSTCLSTLLSIFHVTVFIILCIPY